MSTSGKNTGHPAPIARDGIERLQRQGRIGRLPSVAVCPDCRGRGWKASVVAAPQAGTACYEPCKRCERTGYVGLKESIAEAGGVA